MLKTRHLLIFFALTIHISLFSAMENTPTPYIFPPSQYWDGNDGPWSSFTLRIGEPAQDVRVFVSSIGGETWVVAQEGCVSTDLSICDSLRGGLFYINETSTLQYPFGSTTWNFNGLYELGLEQRLGIDANGEYGFDTVGLNWQGTGGPTLKNQTIAGIATKNFILGLFGLSPRSTNWTSTDQTQSYLHNLRAENLIPSESWAYTAGARWRSSDSYANLTLGGYDESRFVANNVTFPLAADSSADLTVFITSIVTGEGRNATTLLDSKIGALLDSTVSQLWLPLEVCKKFEAEFGLQYDNATGLYLVSNDLHDFLLSRDPSFKFSLATNTSNATVELTIPYSALDLEVSWPIENGSSRYFPLKRASTQFTLGRAFMQETYLIVDYERSSFSVHQTKWDDSIPKIVSIFPPNSTAGSTGTAISAPTTRHHLSGGAIGGIVGGVVLAIVLIFVGILVRRRYKPRPISTAPVEWNKAELDGRGVQEPQISELPVDFHSLVPQSELEGVTTALKELPSGKEESDLAQLNTVGNHQHELPTPHHWVTELEAPMDSTPVTTTNQKISEVDTEAKDPATKMV